MDMQCEYERIAVTCFSSEVIRELKLEGSLQLDEFYPKIQRIKGGYFRTGLSQFVVEEDAVLVSGMIYPRLLYLGMVEAVVPEPLDLDAVDVEEKSVEIAPLEYGFSWQGEEAIYFEELLEFPGIKPGAYVEVKLNPLAVTFERAGVRQVDYQAVLKVEVYGADSREISAVKQLQSSGKVKLEKEQVLVIEGQKQKRSATLLRPSLQLPALKPEINRILDYQVQPVEVSLQPDSKHTILKGALEVTLVYVGNDDEGKPSGIFVNQWNRESGTGIPFELSFDLMDVEGMVAFPEVSLGNLEWHLKSPRELKGELELEGNIKLLQKGIKELVVEVLPEAGIVADLQRQPLNLEEFIGTVETTIEVETQGILAPELPVVERLLNYQAKLGKITLETAEDQILFQGQLNLWLEYMADSLEEPQLAVANWSQLENTGLTVAGVVEFPGITSNALLQPQFSLEGLTVELIGERVFQCRATIKVMMVAKQPRTVLTVEDCALVTPIDPAQRPSILFYVVQPEDTLWKIARRYQITVAALLKANPNIDLEMLNTGQKLIIPKYLVG